MRIESSSLALQSKNNAYSLYEKKEQLQISTNVSSGAKSQQVGFSITNTVISQQDLIASFQDFAKNNKGLSLQDEANRLAQELNKTNNPSSNPSKAAPDITDPFANLSPQDKLKMLLVFSLLGRIEQDPKLMKALGLDSDSLQTTGANAVQANTPTNSNTNPNQATSPIVEYKAQEMLYQSQTAQFSAKGQINTADGQTIQINVNLLMSSQTFEFNETKALLQQATKDPLVINLDGSAAALSDNRFSFDLTGKGTKELIPELSGNRAFLVLDKNKDGVVNNGTELFGPQTNDGFRELAQYDQDKNGWIDERDPVYKDLKLWINAGSSNERLISLKDAGIGALYVGSAPTTFNLKGNQNPQDNLGTIQSTGIFLKEDGSVGTIQHVDLSV